MCANINVLAARTAPESCASLRGAPATKQSAPTPRSALSPTSVRSGRTGLLRFVRNDEEKREAERRKTRRPNLCARRRHVYAVGANHLPGTARARQSALACRRPATALTCGALAPWAQLQARLPGTRTRNGIRRAGVTRPFLSQSSGCTPHTGRSTGEHDARSRSGAVCKSARKHRPRSVFGCASRTRPSSERDEGARNYTEDACQGFCPIKRDVSARSIAFPLS